jgi:glycosyltransferase involved in cell wall biosynthesis
MRGGEKALEPIAARYPEADLFTLVHVKGSVSPTIERRNVHTSFIQRLPNVARYYRHYLPLFPTAIEQFSFDEFDLVIGFSHAVAKSVVVPARTRHLCYCFTPMRYAWDQFDAYFGPEKVGRTTSGVLRPVMARLARWDRSTAGRPNRYLAISRYVAARIRRYYSREATVVYPPVDTHFYHPDSTTPAPHFLIVSALVPYKRIELAMEACRRISARLRIVGDGPERPRLERLAGPGVEFLGRVPDEAVRAEYRSATAVILPGEEDFGIVPVEAQACGRPVVALARGGATETVIDGETGVLVATPDPDAFADALGRVTREPFDPGRIRANAERFSRDRYLEQMQQAVDELLQEPARRSW